MDNESYRQEKLFAWGAVLAGFVFCFMIWAGSDLMNFVMTWGPQGVAVAIMGLLGARAAAVGGAALAFTGYTSLFHWWVQAQPSPDALVWLLYVFTLPGGLLAGIWMARRLSVLDTRPARQAGLMAALAVGAGIATNHVLWHLTIL